jgi:hypothetical protein
VLQGKPLTCEPIVKQFHPIRGDAGFSLQRASAGVFADNRIPAFRAVSREEDARIMTSERQPSLDPATP